MRHQPQTFPGASTTDQFAAELSAPIQQTNGAGLTKECNLNQICLAHEVWTVNGSGNCQNHFRTVTCYVSVDQNTLYAGRRQNSCMDQLHGQHRKRHRAPTHIAHAYAQRYKTI